MTNIQPDSIIDPNGLFANPIFSGPLFDNYSIPKNKKGSATHAKSTKAEKVGGAVGLVVGAAIGIGALGATCYGSFVLAGAILSSFGLVGAGFLAKFLLGSVIWTMVFAPMIRWCSSKFGLN